MSELGDILDACRQLSARGEPFVLATVVRTAGSSYRRPGARMLLPRRGAPIGFISGGCLEGDLAERAGRVLEAGRAETVVYDMRSPDDIVWGLGLGCGGEVRVLLEPVEAGSEPPYLGFLERCSGQRLTGALVTVFDATGVQDLGPGARLTIDERGQWVGDRLPAGVFAERMAQDGRAALERGSSAVRGYEDGTRRIEVLVEFVEPTIRLLVFGAGRDARPVVQAAQQVGWEVHVVDNRPAYARSEMFPEASSVRCLDFDALSDEVAIDERSPSLVMTHHFLHDLELLRFLLDSPTPYLGLLGPRQRAEKLLAELDTRHGVQLDDQQRRRLFGPVGLDIGADTPEEIAVSVLAEIRAVLAGRRGGFLRAREGPLHDELS